MVDFSKSDKMRKMSGKVDWPDIENGFSNDISSLFKMIQGKYFLNKDKISLSMSDLSTFPLIFYIYIYIYIIGLWFLLAHLVS